MVREPFKNSSAIVLLLALLLVVTLSAHYLRQQRFNVSYLYRVGNTFIVKKGSEYSRIDIPTLGGEIISSSWTPGVGITYIQEASGEPPSLMSIREGSSPKALASLPRGARCLYSARSGQYLSMVVNSATSSFISIYDIPEDTWERPNLEVPRTRNVSIDWSLDSDKLLYSYNNGKIFVYSRSHNQLDPLPISGKAAFYTDDEIVVDSKGQGPDIYKYSLSTGVATPVSQVKQQVLRIVCNSTGCAMLVYSEMKCANVTWLEMDNGKLISDDCISLGSDFDLIWE